MGAYIYDDILENHFVKEAWIGAAARGLARAAPTAAKFGLGAAPGIPIGKAGLAGSIAGQVHSMLPTAMGNPGVSVGNIGKTAEYSRREKTASGGALSTAAHLSPYAAWMAGHLLHDSHPRLSKALTAGAYLGYAGSAAHEAATNPRERTTSAVDAAALLAMMGSDIARWNQK